MNTKLLFKLLSAFVCSLGIGLLIYIMNHDSNVNYDNQMAILLITFFGIIFLCIGYIKLVHDLTFLKSLEKTSVALVITFCIYVILAFSTSYLDTWPFLRNVFGQNESALSFFFVGSLGGLLCLTMNLFVKPSKKSLLTFLFGLVINTIVFVTAAAVFPPTCVYCDDREALGVYLLAASPIIGLIDTFIFIKYANKEVALV